MLKLLAKVSLSVLTPRYPVLIFVYTFVCVRNHLLLNVTEVELHFLGNIKTLQF